MRFFLLLLAFLSVNIYAQQNYTINGTISDNETGETLIGVAINVKNTTFRTVCNSYGYYSLTLPKGLYTLTVSSVGYENISQTIDLFENKKIDFKLTTSTETLNEVVVSAKKRNDNIVSDVSGMQKLEMKDIAKIPVLFGEQDVMKTLTLTPGVKTLGEGSGGLFIRGGNNSQNLILLDEAMVYNSNHLMGFFSTFNGDAVKDLTLYKGTAPVEYGGRISSVVDVKMNEGNNQNYHLGGGIGLISSKLNVEGPIVKDKSSFLITGRRTYADLFLKLSTDENIRNNQLYFYDLNTKFNYKIDDKNRIYLSGYFGRDVVGFQDRFGIDWGNITGTLRWNHIWNNKLFSNTSLIYSDYDYKVKIEVSAENKFSLTSVIKNWNLKHKFSYFIDPKNTLTFGFSTQYHTITPGQVDFPASSNFAVRDLQERYALESDIFMSNEWNPNQKIKMTYGLRLNTFNTLGAGDFYTYSNNGTVSDTTHYNKNEIIKTYLNLEPRINISYILNPATSFKASYTRNTQNLHLIQNSNTSTPTDIWISSSNNVKPEISDQFDLGFFKNFKNDEYQFATELYYRWMQNQMDLKNGAEIRANEFLEGELLFGAGRAYGLETMLKKKYGKLNGWISYTISRTERKIDGINNGKWYAARQDATHDISIVGIYDLNKKWSFSSTWVYNTGNAITFPSGKYEIDGNVQYYYTERNGYRMPAYHRLDVGATWTINKTKKAESSLNFSVYNAYGQKNAFSIDFIEDPNDPSRTIAEKTYLFTFVPSITYNFKF